MSDYRRRVVFSGLVAPTGKKPELNRTPTASNRTSVAVGASLECQPVAVGLLGLTARFDERGFIDPICTCLHMLYYCIPHQPNLTRSKRESTTPPCLPCSKCESESTTIRTGNGGVGKRAEGRARGASEAPRALGMFFLCFVSLSFTNATQAHPPSPQARV